MSTRDRMDPQMVIIPAARDNRTDMFIGALVLAGVNPEKACGVPAVREMWRRFSRGEMNAKTVVSNCRKILIVNPTLAEQ